jgi:cytochrome c
MNDRFNTIAGWALGGGIVLLGAMLVTGEIFSAHAPDQKGYPIEGVVEENGKSGAQAEPPIATLLASADAGRGEQAFGKCKSCHTVNQGGANGLGPNLWGVMGGPLGHSPGFAYSEALKGKGGNWDWEQMSQWLRNPRAFAEGTKMNFAGISDPQERADIMLYLNSLGSNLPLPAAPPPEAAAGGEPGANNASGNAAATSNAASPADPDQPAINAGQGAAPPKGGGEGRADPN